MLSNDYFSRFQETPIQIIDGKETLGVWSQPTFLKVKPDPKSIRTYKVTSKTEGRPDLISYNIYGTTFLDWVIIAFNDAHGALNWPKAGDIVEYPTDTIVMSELL